MNPDFVISSWRTIGIGPVVLEAVHNLSMLCETSESQGVTHNGLCFGLLRVQFVCTVALFI